MLTMKTIQAEGKGTLTEITEAVKIIVRDSGIREGLAIVYTPDPDAGILCTSLYDPKVHEDIIDDFTRIWPARDNFHYSGSTVKGAAHAKSAVAGVGKDFIISDGELQLGGSQGIFFAEYCEPVSRVYYVKVFG